MPSAFVPFLKSDGKSGTPVAKSAASLSADLANVSGGFAAMVPSLAPGTSSGSPDSTCAHPPAGRTNQPVVTLKKDGDRVTHIHIQCACGQVVELECAY